MSRFLLVAAALGTLVLVAGCGGSADRRTSGKAPEGRAASCPAAWKAGWQRLANRIEAPVYCPRWMPHPLTGEIDGPSKAVNSVSKDRSYLMGFVWKEREEEIHVNLRGYPGRTTIPTCRQVDFKAGRRVVTNTPCFAEPNGTKRVPGIGATVYTVGQDADQWHISYLWRHAGGLYVLSEHVATPLTYKQVVANLDRMLRSLVLVEPTT